MKCLLCNEDTLCTECLVIDWVKHGLIQRPQKRQTKTLVAMPKLNPPYQHLYFLLRNFSAWKSVAVDQLPIFTSSNDWPGEVSDQTRQAYQMQAKDYLTTHIINSSDELESIDPTQLSNICESMAAAIWLSTQLPSLCLRYSSQLQLSFMAMQMSLYTPKHKMWSKVLACYNRWRQYLADLQLFDRCHAEILSTVPKTVNTTLDLSYICKYRELAPATLRADWLRMSSV